MAKTPLIHAEGALLIDNLRSRDMMRMCRVGVCAVNLTMHLLRGCPPPFLLFSIGLGALGLLGRRRKKKISAYTKK